MVQSYLACINYADTQVGHLLEALKKKSARTRDHDYPDR